MMLLACVPAHAADAVPGVTLPAGTDAYAQLVARAAKGDKAVDFHALRIAYLTSAARAAENAPDISQLKEAMVRAIDAVAADRDAAAIARDNEAVRTLAAQVLSRRWIDIDVHAVMTTACDLLKNKDCSDESEFVVDGLMKSILASGDGKSCAKGWEVISAREEYVVMAMEDADVKRSDFVQDGGHTCQVLEADDGKGGKLTFYFNVDLIRADISSQMAATPEDKRTAEPAPAAPAAAPVSPTPLRPAEK